MITLFFAAWLYLAAHATMGSALGAPQGGPESPSQATITLPEAPNHVPR